MNDIPTASASSVNNNNVSTINSTSNGTSSLSATQYTRNKKNKQSSSAHGAPMKASMGPGPSSIGKKAHKQHMNSSGGNVTSAAATSIGTHSPKFNKHRAQGKLTADDQGTTATKSTSADEVNNLDTRPTGKRKSNKGRTKKKAPTGASTANDSMATTMAQELSASTYECMVCWDVIRRAHHTWTCDTCWAVFHVNCIEKWAKKSLEGNRR
jgi:transcriptional repressor NF-X1